MNRLISELGVRHVSLLYTIVANRFLFPVMLGGPLKDGWSREAKRAKVGLYFTAKDCN